MKTHENPHSQAKIKYSKRQEHVRKDIEHCFGVLVKKFGILKRSLRGWYAEEIKELVSCCVILHNMTQEVRSDNYNFTDKVEWENNDEDTGDVHSIFLEEGNQVGNDIGEALSARVSHMSSSIEDSTKHVELRDDLMEHINHHY